MFKQLKTISRFVVGNPWCQLGPQAHAQYVSSTFGALLPHGGAHRPQQPGGAEWMGWGLQREGGGSGGMFQVT